MPLCYTLQEVTRALKYVGNAEPPSLNCSRAVPEGLTKESIWSKSLWKNVDTLAQSDFHTEGLPEGLFFSYIPSLFLLGGKSKMVCQLSEPFQIP